MNVDIRDDRVNFLIFLEQFFRMLELAAPGDIRNVDEAVDSVLDLNERSKIGKVADLSADLRSDREASGDRIPWILLKLLHSKADPAFFGIDTENLNLDLIAAAIKLLRAARTLGPGDLRNVNKPLNSRLELNKDAVIGNRRDLARQLGVDRVELDNG